MVAPTAECGLTTLTLNLAIALAQTGVRTLLVDADLRSPSVTAALGVNANAGLTGILNGSIVDMDDAIPRAVVTNLEILQAVGTTAQPPERRKSQVSEQS